MHFLPATLLALISTALAVEGSQSCRTSSLPNPIASQYYANITGQINGTLAMLPIPISLARRIIPSEYEILSEQYEAMLPDLAKGMYPALLQAVFDHDIRYMDYQMLDFSRASIEFPFVRYYDTETTPFRYNPAMFMTSTNEMAIKGSSEYGGEVYPAKFEPSCDGYEHVMGDMTSYKTRAGKAFLESTWNQLKNSVPPESLMHFVKHTTNQPLFGVDGMCNHQMRIFNTNLSQGEYAPRGVEGAVRIGGIPGISKADMMWTEVKGIQVSSAFIERHMIPCEEVRDWKYVDDKAQAETSAKGSFEL